MDHPAEKARFRTQLVTRHCKLAPEEVEKIGENLASLGRQVEAFPVADVHLLVERNARSNDFSVKVTLVLPGRTLVGNDHDAVVHAAFDRCLQGLVENLRAYKDDLDNLPGWQKHEEGTRQEIQPSIPEPDVRALNSAVEADDYAAFRTAMFPFEEGVRRRAGRWVQRYPDVEAQIGKGLTVDDIVEEVFLLAFDRYASRPAGQRFGDWLESLLDPAVRALREHQDEEMETINRARSARAAEQGPGAV